MDETLETTLIIAKAALITLDATNLDPDWHFIIELVGEDELQIIRNDPCRDKYEKRQLLAVNCVAPDNQHQKKFRETEVKRFDELATGMHQTIAIWLMRKRCNL